MERAPGPVLTAASRAGDQLPAVRILGLDETRARSVRWIFDTDTQRWRLSDPWMTSFVDLDTGRPGWLLGLAPGRSGAAVTTWVGARDCCTVVRPRSGWRKASTTSTAIVSHLCRSVSGLRGLTDNPMSLPETFRGEVRDVDFEDFGMHPAVVLSINSLNVRLGHVAVIPVTSTHGPEQTHVPLKADAGLTRYEESFADVTALQPMARSRLLTRRGLLTRGELERLVRQVSIYQASERMPRPGRLLLYHLFEAAAESRASGVAQPNSRRRIASMTSAKGAAAIGHARRSGVPAELRSTPVR